MKDQATVHLVCGTKSRRKIFDAAALAGLAGHARQVFAKMDCRLWASDGEADHLHILVEYPAKLSVSVLVNAFKGTSSRMLRRNRPDIASCYRDDVLWSPAYFAASVGGAPLAIIKQYVEQQGQPASSSPSSARLPRAENFVSFLRLMARSGDHWSSTFSRTTNGRVVRNTAP